MAGKRTKTTKRKKITKAPSAKHKTGKAVGKAVGKAPKPASKTTAAKRESLGAVDLLRGWSPSRYSAR